MIRQATKYDLPAIARVHSICFPESYLSQLCRFENLTGSVPSSVSGDCLTESFDLQI